jgi:short-subunit dehydrogenase
MQPDHVRIMSQPKKMESLADRWALVTGASSGIGAEFARQLAARGMHLVLTARREDRLRELAEELHRRHAAKCEVIPIDLAVPDGASQLWSEVEQRGLEIEVLVNNAGFTIVTELENVPLDRILELVRVNVTAVTELTYRALPQMLRRRSGAVINVSSLTGFQPVAYMGAYAASKAYSLHFSESLWAEARDHGVHVMAVCPGTTRTELFALAGVPGWLHSRRSQSPEQVVKSALRALRKRRPVSVPGFRNWALTLFGRFFSRRRVVLESMRYFRPQDGGGEHR